MKEYAFGIDLGGTTAKIGLFKTTGELLEKWEVPTDTSNAGEHILENLAAAVQGKMQEKGLAAAQVEGVGVGVPGPVLDSRIVPIICANLGGWGKHNVAEELSTMLGGIRVLVGNDANVAALGEIWMGAAKGVPQRSHGHAGHRRGRRRHRQRQGHRWHPRCRRRDRPHHGGPPRDRRLRLRQARMSGAVFQCYGRCALHEEAAGREPGHPLHPARHRVCRQGRV